MREFGDGDKWLKYDGVKIWYFSSRYYKKYLSDTGKIVASVNFQEQDEDYYDDNAQILTICEDCEIFLSDDVSDVGLGYIAIDDDCYVQIERRKSMLWLPLVLGVILTLGLLFTFMNKEKVSQISDFIIEDEDAVTQNVPTITETTTFTGYRDIVIDDTNQLLVLSNSETNTVYFQYVLSENGKELYKTNMIRPGKVKNVNLKELLSNGSHKIRIDTLTYDIDSKEPCLSPYQEIIVEVK